MNQPIHWKALLEAAKSARNLAYAPYSRFLVGAAVLTRNGDIFTGCNVENSSLGLTVCAERVAIFNAITQGHREFKAMAIVGDTDHPLPPCGACRQVMAEFNPELPVMMATIQGETQEILLSELLPFVFKFNKNALE